MLLATSRASETDPYDQPQTVLVLPPSAGSFALATFFRETALSFMNEGEHWGKAELAMWLMGPYTSCTQYVPRHAPPPFPVLLREIDARFVDRMIAAARHAVVDLLDHEVATGTLGNFAFDMIEDGRLARCQDARGIDGWVPIATPHSLSDRVLSLLAADYLTRPPVFERQLSTCRGCNRVSFDGSVCSRHTSGFFGGRESLAVPSGA
jgi:hypothetical protein